MPSSETSKQQLLSVRVYRPAASSSLPPVSDQAFAPTTHELAVAHMSQARARERLTDAPMLTKRLRDEKASQTAQAKRARYPQARIRIKFADQTTVESTLPSSSQLDSVYAFARSVLHDEAQSAPFLLYQTPPRREFKLADPQLASRTLLDLELAPSAMLYIRFEDAALNDASRPPLKPALLHTVEELPAPQEPPIPSEAEPQELPEGKPAKKVPKWLNKAIGKK